jgi:nucleotide-binding universal stress UspA family protein
VQSIVVAYDASEPSQEALDRAADLARAFGARLTVTSVAPLMSSPRSASLDPTDPPEERERQLKQAQERLAGRGVEASAVVATGDPGDAIVQVAIERDADLLVMGSRRLGALARMLGQSVSEAVTNRAPCDVYIVREEA